MPIKPPRLKYGDTIAIIAPASAPPDLKVIDRSVEVVERLGFKHKLSAHVRKRRGFLAGTDRERASDLIKAFTDPEVNAVLCVRGGYGSARLLPLLDFEIIRANAKIFIGYSDITSLHCAFLRKANLVSFHGPMLNSDLIKKDIPDFTLQSFRRVLMQGEPSGAIRQGYTKKSVRIVCPGQASGPLLGGNLSVLCTTLGTPYQPSFQNVILFIEDVDEVPYRFDRMFTHLLNASLLQRVAGVAIGVNSNCTDPKAAKLKEYRQTLADVLKERLLPLKIPVVSGLPFGHVSFNATIPVGVRATLDATRGELFINEAAVR